jgi:hypothetical protein
MSPRPRLGFVAACLLVFALIAALITWGPSTGPSNKTPATVTLTPGATRPADLAVTDLHDVGELRARFNADQGAPGWSWPWPPPEENVWRAPGGRPRTSSSATRPPGYGSM